MSIRSAEDRDLPAIAAIHKSRFGSHFLGQYSRRLLIRYYGSFLGKSVFIVHESADGVDGFVLGGESAQMAACRARFVRSNLPRSLWETLMRPRLWLEAIRCGFAAVNTSRPKSDQMTETSVKSNLRLLSIAVSKEAMGMGVASALVAGFEETIQNAHAREYGLSVYKSNRRAVRFYEKLGFEVERETKKSFSYRKRLVREASE